MPDGDVDVFLALVERHRTYMYNLALRLTGREQDAKDVVQESLLHAFVHLDRFEGRADLRLAVKGPPKGTQLKPLILVPEFWFAWSQFRPGTRLFSTSTAEPARRD